MNSSIESMYPGFIFLPLPGLPNLGYGAVEIHIGAVPKERFFDTRRAIFPIVENGILSQVIVEHPWLGDGKISRCHVCAGRFRFYENDGDEHQGFSLGGDLEISQDEEWVSCRLTSSAPLFNLQEDPYLSSSWLVDEMEGVLARRRAYYGEIDNIFMDRLQAVNPLELYIAIIASLKQEILALSPAARSIYQVQYDYIKHIIHILEIDGKWLSVPPLLQDIL